MIVSERQAQEAWDVLRMYARMVDEKWDADELARALGRNDADVKDAYRAACRHAHPDMGGSIEVFAKVDRAKHVMGFFIKRTEAEGVKAHGGVTKCPRCDGKGYMELRGVRLGSVMRKQCPTCTGNGEIYDEKEKGGDRL